MNQHYKKIVSILLTLALLVTPIIAGVPNMAAKSATLKTKKITVVKGKTAKIQLKNKNTSYTYTFQSKNKKIASVTKAGTVKGVKAGSTKITVKESFKKKGKKKTRTIGNVSVTVKNPVKIPEQIPSAIPTEIPEAPQPTTEAPATEAPTEAPVITATPKPTKTPSPVITHIPFTYEDLDTSWIDPDKKLVAFAFDDGPISNTWNDQSPAKRILDALAKDGQHATFFYWGNRITTTNQNEITYAKEIGCEIGNHSWSHPYLTNLTAIQIADEVEQCRAKLEDITGLKNFLLRLPYLASSDLVMSAVNVPAISAQINTLDYDSGSTAASVKKIITDAYINDKLEDTIILMHENYSHTAEAVEYLIPYLLEEDYQIVSVSELAAMHGKTLESGYVYSSIRP